MSSGFADHGLASCPAWDEGKSVVVLRLAYQQTAYDVGSRTLWTWPWSPGIIKKHIEAKETRRNCYQFTRLLRSRSRVRGKKNKYPKQTPWNRFVKRVPLHELSQIFQLNYYSRCILSDQELVQQIHNQVAITIEYDFRPMGESLKHTITLFVFFLAATPISHMKYKTLTSRGDEGRHW